MFTFRPGHLIFTLLLFIVEVLIALFVKDRIIRPYVGDYLVVILVYCAVMTVIKAPVHKVAIGVLLFAYLVELLQYLNVVEAFGLQNSPVAKTVLGTSFEWLDMLAYTLGIITVLFLERVNPSLQAKTRSQ